LDISGKEVLVADVKAANTRLNVSMLKTGIYFIKIESQNKLFGLKKIIKK